MKTKGANPGFGALVFVLLLATCHALGAGYTLTVETIGLGGVSRNPTNSLYPAGATVTLTATPSNAWCFSGWTGDETSSLNPLNVLMTSNKTVTAHFDPIPVYTLSTFVSGAGSVALAPPGGSYLSNTVVTATATPAAGWVFLNWSGDALGNTNPVSVTLSTNKIVTGAFAQIAFIDVPPQSLRVGLNDTATFSVHAVGTPPLSYQWSFAGAPINGATGPSLTLTEVQAVDEGLYSILVTNAYGTSSNAAFLAVTNACLGTNVVHSANELELRNAIAAGGVVRCCFNGTVVLTNTIDVTRDVALDAHDRTVEISGNDSVRLFNVLPGAAFSATNVVFSHGRHLGQSGAAAGTQPAQPGQPGEGGAIFSNGRFVWLTGCVLATNSAIGGAGGSGNNTYTAGAPAGAALGGAIYINGGSLVLDSVLVCSNSAIGGVGGAAGGPFGSTTAPGQSGDALGGAIHADAMVSIFKSTLASNVCLAPAGGGSGASAIGGAVLLASGFLVVTDSFVLANAAVGLDFGYFGTYVARPGSAYGGGLAVTNGSATILGCRIEGNAAQGGFCGHLISATRAQGGGVFSTGTVLAEQSTFSQNRAISGFGTDVAGGGGLFNSGYLTLNRCSVVSNAVIGPGGGQLPLGSGGSPGLPGLGGGICNLSQAIMTNCTIAMNTALGGQGSGLTTHDTALGGPGIGGGFFNSNGIIRGMNITIAANAAVSGAPNQFSVTNAISFGANIAATNGTVWLANSLIAYPGTNGNAWGTITDAGYNMCSDGSANFQSGSSFNFTDPLLLPLADNGGPTPTMALAVNSPAVDFGSSVGAPGIDQRGLPRPMGSGVDIGAYELGGPFFPPVLTLSPQGNELLLGFAAQPNIFYLLQGSSSLSGWSDLETIGPFSAATNVTQAIQLQRPGSEFFRLSLH